MKHLLSFSKSSLAWGLMAFMLVLVPTMAFASGAHGGAVVPNVPTLIGIRVQLSFFVLAVLSLALLSDKTIFMAVS
jgi:hypothetical protein